MSDNLYPAGFDPNLDMNTIGPIPRPDGTYLKGSNVPSAPLPRPKPRIESEPRMDHSQLNLSSGSNIHPGLDEDGFLYPPESQLDTLDNLHGSTEMPDAETQAALAGLFSHHATHSSEPPHSGTGSPHDHTLDAGAATESDTVDQPKKRKAGTSRINMLARGGACEFCKKRKLKCSAEEPACSACRRANQPCIYAQKKQRSKVRQLEDRLADLETRLQSAKSASAAPTPDMSHSAGMIDPSLSVDGAGDLDAFWTTLAGIGTTTADVGFTFPGDLGGWDAGQGVLDQKGIETLMTLADAASSGGDGGVPYAWEGLSEVDIASEIVKAVEGIKGVGEKIVSHLLQLYINARSVPYLHYAVDPRSFLTRILPNSPSPPHPALILSLVPHLLPLSPSTALSDSTRSRLIASKLETPARLHAQHALSIADSRMLDIVATNVIRASQCVHDARLLEGWGSINGAVSMSWAAGLGKLGGVAEQLRPTGSIDLSAKKERSARLSEIRLKVALMEPPKTMLDLSQRVELFWQVYTQDKTGSIGWNFPSLIIDEEITTPFPGTYNDKLGHFSSDLTINDLMEGRAQTGTTDTPFCARVKAICLLQRAIRLFDLPRTCATPERTNGLRQVTEGYMATLPPLKIFPGAKIGQQSQSWQMLHLTLLYLSLKQELDLPASASTAEKMVLVDGAIASAEAAMNPLEALYQTGDVELDGLDLYIPGPWGGAGRTIFMLATRLEREGGDDSRVDRLRSVGARLTAACHTLGKRMPFARLIAQKLENNSKGHDDAHGIWERTDLIA